MKTNRTNKLENIINSVKQAGKKVGKFVKDNAKTLALTTALAVGGNAVYGDRIVDKLIYNSGDAYTDLRHQSNAKENFDGSDSIFLEGPALPRINFYSRNSLCNPDKLTKDVRPLESMTTYTSEIEGVGLSQPENCSVIVYCDQGFQGENIIKKLTDGNNNTIQIYDGKKLASHYPNPAFAIQVDNGISKKLNTEFYASADLNIDGRVDMEDYAILSKNWLTNVVQTDVYSPNGFADINKNGTVDVVDLALFAQQWLNEKAE